MKLTVSQDALASALTVVAKAVSNKNTVPVLGGIYLSAQGDTLTLRATDLELAMECTVPAQVVQAGAVVLPSRYLTDLVRRIPFGDIRMQVDTGNYTATLHWEKSQYTIHGLQPDQFPFLPEPETAGVMTLAQPVLRDLLRQTIFAASHDETRPYLTGVYFTTKDNRLQGLATDGVRIAYAAVPVTDPAPVAAIIPSRTLTELSRVLSGDHDAEVRVSATATHAFFLLPAVKVVSRLLDGQYPDVMRLVPQAYQTRSVLSRVAFLEACDRAALIAKDGAVKLTFSPDTVTITANTPEVGQVYEELGATLEGDGLEIGFNSRYLLEGLKAMEAPEFTFEFSGSRNPSRMRPSDSDSFLYVVLPLITY